MSESIWQRSECGPGRAYMLGTEPYVKFDDQETIITAIKDILKKYINIKTAVRLTLDTQLSNPERAIIAIPFESDDDQLLTNFAQILYQSLMGYYISADPHTSHFGIANLLLEGKLNSLLKREIELLLNRLQNRPDMAGRLLNNVELINKVPVPKTGDVFLAETIRKGLDIHIGYRIFVTGSDINYTKIFLPIRGGQDIIDHIYYNLEQILHHNFVTYDETGDRYLAINETLIFKDLEATLKRAKSKEMTRNKILNNLQFNTIATKEIVPELEMLAGDSLYDFLNHIQDTKLQNATEQSRELYVSYLQEAVHSLNEVLGEEAEVPEEAVTAEASTPARRTREGSSPDRLSNQPPPRRAPGVPQRGDRPSEERIQVPQPPTEHLRVPSSRQSESTLSPEKVKV
ncbi:hypothetical protein KKI24_06310 [bacterium]|nr:hypothetical protein [bacterium]